MENVQKLPILGFGSMIIISSKTVDNHQPDASLLMAAALPETYETVTIDDLHEEETAPLVEVTS